MKDLRNKNSNIIFRGKTIASENNTEAKVGDMLSFMGIKHDLNLIQTACGYLSMNNMQANINNIETFLKEKNIINTADFRKKSSSIVTVNSAFNDTKYFCDKMIELGYKKMTNTDLIKDFEFDGETIEINIDIDPEKRNIKTISAYKDSKICDIPKSILEQVGNDLNSARY